MNAEIKLLGRKEHSSFNSGCVFFSLKHSPLQKLFFSLKDFDETWHGYRARFFLFVLATNALTVFFSNNSKQNRP